MNSLLQRYQRARALSELLCEPLQIEDFVVQPRAEVSPPKWHLAHTTWFFETFLLQKNNSDYTLFSPHFPLLFNSYYKTQGTHWIQGERGQLSRPTVKQVYAYRQHVDEQVQRMLQKELPGELHVIANTGIHHEQQHQELLLMDIKAILAINPEMPAYIPAEHKACLEVAEKFIEIAGGDAEFGVNPEQGFSFCNETPRHRRFQESYLLANRPVSNGEYLKFIESGAYREPFLWKSDGWSWVEDNRISAPLYWHLIDGAWYEYSLHGDQPLDLNAPVCHISWYEADAYACWAKARLPTEFELELAYQRSPAANQGFFQASQLSPAIYAQGDNFYSLCGNLWEWSASPYVSYPRYKRPEGAFGEYNQKFMANQMVLRGGCFGTSRDHYRTSYRNFFFPQQRWAFTGFRLARDL